MSISLISEPQKYQPGFNPIEFVFSSTNATQCEFNYIADLYVNGAFAIRLKAFPEPSTNYGKFRIERVLQDFLSFDFHPEIDDFETNANSICDYYIEIRERYNSTPECSGLPVLQTVGYTSTSKYCWNGALQYNEFPGYNQSGFITGSMSSRFLTNSPNNLKIRIEDYSVLNVISEGIESFVVNTFDYSGNNVGSYTKTNTYSTPSTTEQLLLSIPSGPSNINSVVFDGSPAPAQPVITSSISYYTITLKNSMGDDISETRRFRVDNSCTNFRRYSFHFLNRLGGFDTQSFIYKSYKRSQINRGNYTKVLDNNYQIGDRGESALTVDSDYSFTVNSNWLSESESLWIEELYTSLEVYVYEFKTKETTIFITGAACSLSPVAVDLVLSAPVDIGTSFTYSVNDGSPIGMPNSGSGIVLSYDSISGYYRTSIPCLYLAGAFITGTFTYLKEVSGLIPIVITNTQFEEKIKVNVKNIMHTIEFRTAYKANNQSF